MLNRKRVIEGAIIVINGLAVQIEDADKAIDEKYLNALGLDNETVSRLAKAVSRLTETISKKAKEQTVKDQGKTT